MKNIFYISSLAPANDVAGPLLMYRHLTLLAQKNRITVITHDLSGTSDIKKWKEIRIPFKNIRKIVSRIFYRKYVFIIGELIDNIYFIVKSYRYLKSDKPDLIITSWFPGFLITSWFFSKWFKIPYFIVCHDDLESMTVSDFITNPLKHILYKKVYKDSKVNFCISPLMQEYYSQKYEKEGVVLYPISGSVSETLQKAEKKSSDYLRIGYFGSISNGYYPILFLANSIIDLKAKIYISSTGFPISGPYKNHPAIINSGFFNNRLLLTKYIEENIDVALIAQGFEPEIELQLRTNFPSKLIDMCSFSLPLLIISPSYSSSGYFAKKYPEATEYIDTLETHKVYKAIKALMDSKHRSILSENVSKVYQSEFTTAQIQEVLESNLI